MFQSGSFSTNGSLREGRFNFDLLKSPALLVGPLPFYFAAASAVSACTYVCGCDADDKSFWEFTARVVILPPPSLSPHSFFLPSFLIRSAW